jgi:hypothetical protein
MQFSYLSLAALIAVASATPTNMKRQTVPLCSSGSPQCCSTDILGLVDLDCANRKLQTT